MSTVSERSETDIQVRLRRIEGQIRGIIGMFADGKSCEQVVTQMLAARAAMDGVTSEVLKVPHRGVTLRRGVTRVARGGLARGLTTCQSAGLADTHMYAASQFRLTDHCAAPRAIDSRRGLLARATAWILARVPTVRRARMADDEWMR